MEKQILSFISRQFRVGVSKGEDEAETTIAFGKKNGTWALMLENNSSIFQTWVYSSAWSRYAIQMMKSTILLP